MLKGIIQKLMRVTIAYGNQTKKIKTIYEILEEEEE